MKKLIYFIVIVAIGIYAWNKFDVGQYLNMVKIDADELKNIENTADTALDQHIKARKDIYQILVLMNEVTINTMKLEQVGEGKIQGNNQASMKQQLQEKMKLLKEQLAEAREYAKENAELTAELEQLQHSFVQREQTIKRLTQEGADLDRDIALAIEKLKIENENLRAENDRLANKNAELGATVNSRKRSEISAWEIAGGELVNAARIIPKGNVGGLLQGNQSMENKRSRQKTLQNAFNCYNDGIRLANRYGNPEYARALQRKAIEADRLLQNVNEDKDI